MTAEKTVAAPPAPAPPVEVGQVWQLVKDAEAHPAQADRMVVEILAVNEQYVVVRLPSGRRDAWEPALFRNPRLLRLVDGKAA